MIGLLISFDLSLALVGLSSTYKLGLDLSLMLLYLLLNTLTELMTPLDLYL